MNLALSVGAVSLLFVAGCGFPQLPSGINDEEVRALGITQGIAGKSAIRGGDCMPGMGINCSVGRAPFKLRVLKEGPPLTPDLDGACTSRAQLHPIVLAADSESIAEVDLHDKDRYGIELADGTYELVLIDDAQCARCFNAEGADGGLECRTVQVDEGSVTRLDLLFDWSAQ